MKKVFALFVVIIIYLQLPAQNVGIGNTNPQTALDVKGVIRSRPDTAIISQQYQLVDVTKTNYIRIKTSVTQITGLIYNFILTPGTDGQHLRLESIGGSCKFYLISKTYINNGKLIVLREGIAFPFDERKGSYIDLFYSDAIGWTEIARYYLPDYVTSDLHKQVFTSSGNFIVPYGIDSITVAIWGAGGHSGGSGNSGSGIGGNGGFVAGKLKVVQGETLIITPATATSSNGYSKYSSIVRQIELTFNILVLAAGGGNGTYYGGIGGNAGAVGQSGILNTEPGTLGAPGGGATVSAGGAGGLTGNGGGTNGTNGGSLVAGVCTSQINSKEGGGGAGYFGGGGASSFYSTFFSIVFASGGGGGGSNYATDFAFTHNSQVGNISPGNSLYDNGGFGGFGPGSTNPNSIGQAGKVVIIW